MGTVSPVGVSESIPDGPARDGLSYENVDKEREKMVGRQNQWTTKVGLLCLFMGAIVVFTTGVAGAGFRFRVHVNYISGVEDLADTYEESVEAETGVDLDELDTFVIPVGIALSPYYQWDSGLMLGGEVGPFMFLYTQVETIGFFEDEEDTFTHWQLPVNVTIGYNFFPNGPVSPYIRVGPSYHFAGGDFYDSSNVGFIVAGGAELLKSDHFALGVEAAYDSAEVEIETSPGRTKGVKAAEFTVGLFLQFQ
jgi:opacity protein-like surface antigen